MWLLVCVLYGCALAKSAVDGCSLYQRSVSSIASRHECVAFLLVAC